MSTGYLPARARPHDQAVVAVAAVLDERGYGPVVELDVDGHRPDLQLASGHFVDVKTGGPNLAIEIDSLNTYRQVEIGGGRRVYIVHVLPADWRVHTPDSVTAGIEAGPRRSSGAGSNDDWYLCCNRGTAFDDFFPGSNG